MNILYNLKIAVLIYIMSILAAITKQYLESKRLGLVHYLLAIFLFAPIITCLFVITGTLFIFFLKWLMPDLLP